MGQPQKREWTVDLRARDEDGGWYYDEDFAHQRTIDALLECATIQHREGGTFIVAPIRTQMGPAPDALSQGVVVWANLGLVVQHTFTPPVRQREPETRPQLAEDTQPDPFRDVPFEDEDDEMRDEDERAVAAELDGVPDGGPVIPQPPLPLDDVDAERSRMDPSDLMPKVG